MNLSMSYHTELSNLSWGLTENSGPSKFQSSGSDVDCGHPRIFVKSVSEGGVLNNFFEKNSHEGVFSKYL